MPPEPKWSRGGFDLVAAFIAGVLFLGSRLLVVSDGPWDFVPPTTAVFAYFLAVWWRRQRGVTHEVEPKLRSVKQEALIGAAVLAVLLLGWKLSGAKDVSDYVALGGVLGTYCWSVWWRQRRRAT